MFKTILNTCVDTVRGAVDLVAETSHMILFGQPRRTAALVRGVAVLAVGCLGIALVHLALGRTTDAAQCAFLAVGAVYVGMGVVAGARLARRDAAEAGEPFTGAAPGSPLDEVCQALEQWSRDHREQVMRAFVRCDVWTLVVVYRSRYDWEDVEHLHRSLWRLRSQLLARHNGILDGLGVQFVPSWDEEKYEAGVDMESTVACHRSR